MCVLSQQSCTVQSQRFRGLEGRSVCIILIVLYIYTYDGYKRSAKCGFRLDYFSVLSDTKAAEFEKASQPVPARISPGPTGESLSCSLARGAGWS